MLNLQTAHINVTFSILFYYLKVLLGLRWFSKAEFQIRFSVHMIQHHKFACDCNPMHE
jgi:uncharacterized protein (DUF305 family)